ncbi:hypothetical protein DERP_008610 [Dermatophagoides pteronyssinus]|uniref:Uncharacterized protein n=1 Tax=Dermatophagoides pteronyssinus TaxID=6956 RepID=A0ABQ8IWW6_DERPT|nr:hypothetical protein DERP_008610 [Dermatophagoides pteronyssinus]
MVSGDPPSIPGAIIPPPTVASGSRKVGSLPNADGSLPCAEIAPIKSVGALAVGSRSKPVTPSVTLGSLLEGSRPRPADAASKLDIPVTGSGSLLGWTGNPKLGSRPTVIGPSGNNS